MAKKKKTAKKKVAKKKGKPSQFCWDEFGVWGVGIGCINCIDKELVDAAVISGTCGCNRPGSLAPTHAGPTSRSLRNSPVNHYKTNSLFRSIIGRIDAIPLQE